MWPFAVEGTETKIASQTLSGEENLGKVCTSWVPEIIKKGVKRQDRPGGWMETSGVYMLSMDFVRDHERDK